MHTDDYCGLRSQLQDIQRSKEQGLLKAADLFCFLDLLDGLKILFRSSSSHGLELLRAVLCADTYVNPRQHGEQTYIGPHTFVKYENGETTIHRAVGDHRYSEPPFFGVELHLQVGDLASIGSLIQLLKADVDWSAFKFEQRSGTGIGLLVRIPLERLRRRSFSSTPT